MASPIRDQYKPGSGKLLKNDDTVLDLTAILVKLDAVLSATTGLVVDATLDASDIEIGAVELKNGATDARATINAVNTARTTADVGLVTQEVDPAGTTTTNVTAGADAVSNTRTEKPVSSRLSGFNGTTWDRLRTAVTTVSATLTGFLNTLPWGIYHAAPSTRTEGQGGPVETDEKGNTRIVEQKKPGAEYNSEKYIAVSQKYVNTTTNKPTSTVNLSFQTATISSAPVLLVSARIVNKSAGARWLFLNNATSIAGSATPTIPPIQIAANSSVSLTPQELGGAGYRFDTALTVGNSSDPSAFTAATAGDLLIQLFTTTATS